jgi:hypothetical protein
LNHLERQIKYRVLTYQQQCVLGSTHRVADDDGEGLRWPDDGGEEQRILRHAEVARRDVEAGGT